MSILDALFDLPAGVSAGTCIGCGCTPWQACMTEDGPCHWAAKDLCSACVGKPQGRTAVADRSAPRPERSGESRDSVRTEQ